RRTTQESARFVYRLRHHRTPAACVWISGDGGARVSCRDHEENDEIRMTNDEINPNDEILTNRRYPCSGTRVLCFVVPSSFVIQISALSSLPSISSPARRGPTTTAARVWSL